MQKTKYITKDNYLEFKPSEFIRSFVSDVDTAIKKKKNIDMSTYYKFDACDNCLPCLGGIAVINMKMNYRDKHYFKIKQLGDAIRCNNWDNVRWSVENIFNYKDLKILKNPGLKEFQGIVKPNQFNALKAQINKIADVYEKAGY